MNVLKPLIATAAIAAGALGAGAAQARTDVHWSVNVGLPLPMVVAPAPVYVQPAPVYVAPAQVYRVAPQRMYHHGPPRWDMDGDGVPNRHDRRPHNPRHY
ncbi:MAG: hypothetical protein WAQ05_01400 [Rubrivivax sp.]